MHWFDEMVMDAMRRSDALGDSLLSGKKKCYHNGCCVDPVGCFVIYSAPDGWNGRWIGGMNMMLACLCINHAISSGKHKIDMLGWYDMRPKQDKNGVAAA